jgi:hypothetical protein
MLQACWFEVGGIGAGVVRCAPLDKFLDVGYNCISCHTSATLLNSKHHTCTTSLQGGFVGHV